MENQEQDMDFLDELMNESPREKFLQMLKHANAGAVELTIERLLKEHIAMSEFFEARGISEGEFELFRVENEALIESRLNDYFIGLTAEILSAE